MRLIEPFASDQDDYLVTLILWSMEEFPDDLITLIPEGAPLPRSLTRSNLRIRRGDRTLSEGWVVVTAEQCSGVVIMRKEDMP